MGLYCDTYVNERLIGHAGIIRISPLTLEQGDDTICTYSCKVDNHSKTYTFEVTHRYGDGALELLAKVYINAAALENGQP